MCSKFFNQLHSLDKINREILTKFIPINNIRPIEIYPIFRSADFKCATVPITWWVYVRRIKRCGGYATTAVVKADSYFYIFVPDFLTSMYLPLRGNVEKINL